MRHGKQAFPDKQKKIRKAVYIITCIGYTDDTIGYIKKALKSKWYQQYCHVNMSISPKYNKQAGLEEIEQTKQCIIYHQCTRASIKTMINCHILDVDFPMPDFWWKNYPSPPIGNQMLQVSPQEGFGWCWSCWLWTSRTGTNIPVFLQGFLSHCPIPESIPFELVSRSPEVFATGCDQSSDPMIGMRNSNIWSLSPRSLLKSVYKTVPMNGWWTLTSLISILMILHLILLAHAAISLSKWMTLKTTQWVHLAVGTPMQASHSTWMLKQGLKHRLCQRQPFLVLPLLKLLIHLTMNK